MPHNIIIGRAAKDKRKFGDKGIIFLGRHYVKMEQTVSLSSNIFMDVARTHVVLIDGKRGCLTGVALIYTDRGYKKIKDFNEKKDKVYSFDKKSGNFEIESAKLLSYDINEELFKINLTDGQELIATAEHPFLVKSENKYSWKIASELSEKDKIVSVVKLPKTRARGGISKRLARLLGFLLADGTLFVQKGRFKDGRGYWYNGTKKRLRIINAQEEVLVQAKADLEKEFGIVAKRYERKRYNCEVIETKYQKVVNRFVNLGVPAGKKSNIIRVPKSIFLSSKDVQSQFLKALFSCDGFVHKNGGYIEYYSNSVEMMKDLQLVLGNFDIHSKVEEKKAKCNGKRFLSYRLTIRDYESVKNFQDEIGFFSEEKRNRLEKRKFFRVSRRKKTEYISKSLFFEDIKSITKKKTKTKVYDLRVPKNHSFIANGVVSHNSGKSYTLGVMAEEMSKLDKDIAKNLSVLIFDTMGIFWTMKYPNQKEEKLLVGWNMSPEKLSNIDVYVPEGYFKDQKKRGVLVDFPLSIKTSELDASDWVNVFGIELMHPIGVAIEKSIANLQDEKSNYGILDIINEINSDRTLDKEVKDAAINRLLAAESWGLFSKSGTEIKDLVKGGRVSIVDISAYSHTSGSWGIKNLVVGIICKKLLQERMIARKLEELRDIEAGSSFFGFERESKEKDEMPLVWILIDEAHEFLPKEGRTGATDALVQLLREGRQPGISMVLATQQPGEIHKDVITQSDIVISHRITAKKDIDALNDIMQTYMLADIQRYINNLPRMKGAAIILDDNSERIYPMNVRPRFTWHGGEAPSSVHLKARELLELEF